jgi:hypothetical protein
METLQLTNIDEPTEVILEIFDEDPELTILTVIDDESNPATVTLTDEELQQIRNWINERLGE